MSVYSVMNLYTSRTDCMQRTRDHLALDYNYRVIDFNVLTTNYRL